MTRTVRRPMSLDDLVAAIREVLAKRFPQADWASLVIHTPTLPDTILTVSPRRPGGSSPEAAQPLPLSS